MNLNALTENDLELLSLHMILFADDIVLFMTAPNSVFKKRKQNVYPVFYIDDEKRILYSLKSSLLILVLW